MNIDEFYAVYKPVINHLDNNASLDGYMFETYDAENEVIEMCAKQIDEQSETHYTCNQTYHDLRRVSKDIRNLKVKG